MGEVTTSSLDDLKTPGVYLLNPNVTTSPDSGRWGVVLVFNPHPESEDNAAQIWIGQRNTLSRATFGNKGEWTNWL